jgi:hypothetical protein
MRRITYAIILTLFAFSGPTLAQSSTLTSTTTTGVITGRVIDSAGHPLAGATINVGKISDNSFRRTVSTDSDGEFKVDGLERAVYAIFAFMPGYVPITRATEFPNFYRLGDAATITMSKGGVITGKVTGRNGPLVGLGVFATRVRDADGKKVQATYPGSYERRTDDRGIFRLYGLPPGAYVIIATKPRVGTILPSVYDLDVPTFYPSGPRDTAKEIVLREGDEVTADLNYRGNPGHTIGGQISGVISDNRPGFRPSAQVTLTDVRDRIQIANAATSWTDNTTYALYGVPDGEYELSAWQSLRSGDVIRSMLQRVKVRGADVTGINMKLEPLGSIAGRLVFENDAKASCGMRKDTVIPETLVYARMVEPVNKNEVRRDEPRMLPWPGPYGSYGVGDAKGAFTVKSLIPGSYRIDPHLFAAGWYVRAVTFALTPARANGPTSMRDQIGLRIGDRLNGVTVEITEGAALLHGKLLIAGSQAPASRLRAYLVPSEPEAAGNVYRFYEAPVGNDGSFTLDNVAPGKYLIGSRPAEENELGIVKAVRQDEALRAKVREEAQARNQPVTLKPCEQVGDFSLQALSAPR